MRVKSGAIAIFLSALLLAALGHSVQADERVNVARSGIDIAFAPIEVGREAHIWSDLGLDVEVLDVPGTRIEQVLTSGDADVGLGAAVALGARLKGVPTMGVAAIADLPYNFTLIVPTDSPIKAVTDLRGRSVAVSTAGSLTEWLVREVARQEGWGTDGIKTVPLGGDEARIAALRSAGGIDADLAGLMQAVDLQDKGQIRIVVYFGDIVRDFQNLVLKASDKFIAEHPDRLERFLQGWYRTVAYMKTHPDETTKVIASAFRIDPAAVAKALPVEMKMMSTDGSFSAKGMEVVRQSLVELKILPTLPAMSDLITERFVPVKLK
jgi:ABC-type nitrate/sulfonate/bicarbonate transport system substrate-binding protein